MQGNVDLRYGSDKDSSFVVRYFEDFYGEIVRQKSLVLGGNTLLHANAIDVGPIKISKPDLTPPVIAAGPELPPEAESPPEPQVTALPEEIIKALFALLSSQALDSARYGGEFAAKYFKEAEFIMAALADEIFLHLEWEGKIYWEKNLLEDRLYGTHNAGQLFFDKIDTFLTLRDPSRADLAMLYLLALGLGFRGKYRDQDDGGRIEHYKRQMFVFIYHRDPTLYELGTHLIPENYQHNIEGNTVTFLNDVRPWVLAFSSVGLVLLLASYVVWQSTTSSINELTKSIIDQSGKR